MKHKNLTTASLILAAAGLLSACGGGDTGNPATSATQKSGSTEQSVVAPDKDGATAASESQTLHSSNAYVLTAANTAKQGTSSTSLAAKMVPRSTQRQLSPSQTIDLGAPSNESLAQREQFNSKASGVAAGAMKAKRYQIGFARPVSATSQPQGLQQVLSWTTLANGNLLGAARFESPDAVGIRLGLLIQSLPNEAIVRVSAANAESALEISGATINQAISANVAADGDSTNARTYWLPMALGATTDLEIELPAGIGRERVSVALPSLMHMVETAPQASLNNFTPKTDCAYRTPDAMCSTPLPPAANAIAAMEFVDSDLNGLAVCTGTLLADKGATQQPYFLTAQHCINNQTEATSLATFWFWRSTACGGTLRSDYFDTTSFYRTGGATLLFTRTELTTNARNPIGTDTTLLRLNETPPAGVMFAGWSTQRQAITPSVSLIGLHQPKGQSNSFAGDILRQSTGTISGMGRISGYLNGDPELPLVQQSNDATQPMYQVSWSSGITEGGSSGSALLLNGTTSNPQVVGQLWGGASSCDNPTSPDFYGRFDLSYQDGLINWLNPGYRLVFRFYRPSSGTHFFTSGVDERDATRANNLSMGYEGPVFSVSPTGGAGLNPVYRFYNTQTGVHFYTISEDEKNSVQANLSNIFTLEGVAWYARLANDATPGTIEVYRFFRKSAGTHFYTTSAEERDNIINNLGQYYSYEGVAYRAWPTS